MTKKPKDNWDKPIIITPRDIFQGLVIAGIGIFLGVILAIIWTIPFADKVGLYWAGVTQIIITTLISLRFMIFVYELVDR